MNGALNLITIERNHARTVYPETKETRPPCQIQNSTFDFGKCLKRGFEYVHVLMRTGINILNL